MVSQQGLAERVIIVTGAGKGLGRAYALHLAASGAAVVINNRWSDRGQPSSAQSVADEIARAGGRAVASSDSVEDPASGEAMVRQALDTFGRLDGLIANAGVPEAASFGRQSLEDFRSVFDINFFGTLHVVHAVWKVLMAQKYGRVVVSTSSAGLHGNRGMPAYSSSKAALIGLTRALANEGERSNVLINAVAPYAATAMTSAYIDEQLARKMTPEAAAPLASWLVSDMCDVAGQTFVVGAGRLRRARMVEGPVVHLADDVASAVHAANADGSDEPFPHAHAAFEAFLTRTPAA